MAFLSFSICSVSKATVGEQQSQEVSDSNLSPLLLLDKTEIDLGDVQKSTPISSNVLLINAGTADLVIKKIKAPCACTTYNIKDETVIYAGESRELLIEFNPTGYEGKVNKSIILFTNDNNFPEVVITITGNVIKEYGNLTIIPKTIGLGLLMTPEWRRVALVRFPTVYDSNDVLCFSSSPHIQAKIQGIGVTQEVDGYDLRRINDKACFATINISSVDELSGKIYESITIASRTKKFIPITVSIAGQIAKAYSLFPETMHLFFPSNSTMIKKHFRFHTSYDEHCEVKLVNMPSCINARIRKVVVTKQQYGVCHDVYLDIERKIGLSSRPMTPLEFEISCNKKIYKQKITLSFTE
jgi:hypothetical protein